MACSKDTSSGNICVSGPERGVPGEDAAARAVQLIRNVAESRNRALRKRAIELRLDLDMQGRPFLDVGSWRIVLVAAPDRFITTFTLGAEWISFDLDVSFFGLEVSGTNDLAYFNTTVESLVVSDPRRVSEIAAWQKALLYSQP